MGRSHRTPGTARTGRPARVGAVLAAVTALLLAGAGPAHAEGYRYWAFWTREDDGWRFATQGPAQLRPADGQVVGFRFGVGGDAGEAPRPRDDARFERVCADTPPAEGRKRVALVLDFGTADDAPAGESPPRPRTVCAVVDERASAADALLDTAEPLRFDANGLLCALDGYPRRGCGDPVDEAAPGEASEAADAREAAGSGGPSLGLLGSVAAVALLGGAALWQVRRRRG